MNENEKLQQLKELEVEIKRTLAFEDEAPWVFPIYGNVKGFWGTRDVMFVAYRPSMGTFPSDSDRLLYSTLEKHGVADAHLTDAIKTPAKAGKKYTGDIAPHIRILIQEIEIIKPQLLIAFGKDAYELLESNFLPSLKGIGIESTLPTKPKRL